MIHPNTSWAPEADLAEQQTPATPDAGEAADVHESPSLLNADEADVLEQASVLTFLDDDDYRQVGSAENRT
jgi:hypothetical protein